MQFNFQIDSKFGAVNTLQIYGLMDACNKGLNLFYEYIALKRYLLLFTCTAYITIDISKADNVFCTTVDVSLS